MRLRCNGCGKVVSTEVPKGTIVRGWIECSKCILDDINVGLNKTMDKAVLKEKESKEVK